MSALAEEAGAAGVKPTDDEIIEYLKTGDDVDRDMAVAFARVRTIDVANRFGISPETALRRMSALARKGRVQRVRDVIFGRQDAKAIGWQWWEHTWNPDASAQEDRVAWSQQVPADGNALALYAAKWLHGSTADHNAHCFKWRRVAQFPVSELARILPIERWREWYAKERTKSPAYYDHLEHAWTTNPMSVGPVLVTRHGDKIAVGGDGWHRSAIAVLKGMTHVPAIVGTYSRAHCPPHGAAAEEGAVAPREAAAGMLERYSSPKIAIEMAGLHKQDQVQGSAQWNYWTEVEKEIQRQARVDVTGVAREAVRATGNPADIRTGSGVTPKQLAQVFLAGVYYHDMEPDLIVEFETDPRVAKIESALRRLGVAWATILGYGSFGTAARLPDGRVVKVTSDPLEVQASAVLTGKRLDHVVEFYGAWFVEGVKVDVGIAWDADKDEEILAEKRVGIVFSQYVVPMSIHDDHRQRLSRIVSDFTEKKKIFPLGPKKQARTKLYNASIELEGLLRRADFNDVASALTELRSEGIYAIDAHGGNVGYDHASGTWRLFDIGASSPPDTPKAGTIRAAHHRATIAQLSLANEAMVPDDVRVPEVAAENAFYAVSCIVGRGRDSHRKVSAWYEATSPEEAIEKARSAVRATPGCSGAKNFEVTATRPVRVASESSIEPNVVRRVAQMIALGVSKQDIRDRLIADGMSEEEAFLAYHAAVLYERDRR